jgi:hypothetical protein
LSRWSDAKSSRDVWVVAAESTRDWPEPRPWPSATFGLLVVAEHVVDVEPLARRALAQGLVFASTWGPGCELIEEELDDVIAAEHPRETPDDVVLTTSHPDESLEETIEFFLEVAYTAPAYTASCAAWVVFAIGPLCLERVERALERRGAARRE